VPSVEHPLLGSLVLQALEIEIDDLVFGVYLL
jgi:hypothetical protein